LDIIFKTNELEKACNGSKAGKRKFGAEMSRILRRRLDELRAATVLNDIRFIPQARCHELKGNRKGELAVDLYRQYRLIFEPANKPIPTKPDGGLDWTKVTAIKIIGVVDYHE